MKKKLRVPLLLLGAWLGFMGVAEIIMSRWKSPPETARCLLGAVMVGFGVLAIWDGCRDTGISDFSRVMQTPSPVTKRADTR